MNENNTSTSFQGTEVPPRQTPPNAIPTVSYIPADRVLQRKNRMIAGVVGGLADYFRVDVTIMRLAFVVLALLTFPALPIAYVIAWIIIPDEDKTLPMATGPIATSPLATSPLAATPVTATATATAPVTPEATPTAESPVA